MKPYVIRGVLAGVVGSIASVLVLLLLGEASIRSAIALEEAAATGEAHDEVFSRGTQVLGGVLGVVLVGVALGLVFGVVYAACQHRLGAGEPWRRARRLGVIAFVAVPLVPFLKYPANPPAVGDPATVGERTVAYVSLLAISVLAVVLAGAVHDRLRRRGLTEPAAQAAALGLWLAVIAGAYLVLPAGPAVTGVPADLLWSFRLASIGGQAAFWAVTATAFGLLCSRVLSREAPAPSRPVAPVTGPNVPPA